MDIDANYIRFRLNEAGSTFLALSASQASDILQLRAYSALAWSMSLVKWEFRSPAGNTPGEAELLRMRATYSWPMRAALQVYTDIRQQTRMTQLLIAKSLPWPNTDRRLIGWRVLKRELDLPRGTMRVLHQECLEHCAAYVRKTHNL